MKRYLWITLGVTAYWLGFTFNAWGQEETESLDIQLRVFSDRRLEGLHLYQERGDSPLLQFFTGSVSPVYRYQGSNPIYFFRKVASPTEEDPNAVVRVPVARFEAPPNASAMLLLFFPDRNAPEGTERYVLYGVDEDESAFPFGSVRLINLNNQTFEALIGGRPQSIRPGANPPVAVSPGVTSIGVVRQINGRYHKAYENFIRLSANQRAWLILYPPFLRNAVEVTPRLLIEDKANREEERIVHATR